MNNLNKLYAIVALGNGNVMAIPCIWLVQKNYSPIIKNKDYELYLPLHESVKQAEKYADIKKHWVKSFCTVLDITGKIKTYNFLKYVSTLYYIVYLQYK